MSRQFQFYSRQLISICSRQFQFYSLQFQFAHGNFNLFTAISIYSPQFQFTHGNFNLLTAISIYPRQFQSDHGNFNYGNFNFPHGNFNILTAISQFYSGQIQFFHGNAHGILRFSHHLSVTAADSGYASKVKTQNQKGIVKVDLQREK